MKKLQLFSVLFLVVVALFAVFFTVQASGSATKSACIDPPGDAPKACLYGAFQWDSGTNVKITSRYVALYPGTNGWSVSVTTSPYCSPVSCGTWYSGTESVGTYWKWYRNGVYQYGRACAHGGDNQGGVLKWAKACSW